MPWMTSASEGSSIAATVALWLHQERLWVFGHCCYCLFPAPVSVLMVQGVVRVPFFSPSLRLAFSPPCVNQKSLLELENVKHPASLLKLFVFK